MENVNLWGVQILWKEGMIQERSIGKGILPGCAWDKPCRRHVRKVQIAACGGFAAFAGVWGVPSQRFRISQKDILKHCWPEEWKLISLVAPYEVENVGNFQVENLATRFNEENTSIWIIRVDNYSGGNSNNQIIPKTNAITFSIGICYCSKFALSLKQQQISK